MKTRRWIRLITALFALLAMFVLPSKVQAADAYVFDETGILSSSELSELNELAEEISLRQKCGVYVIIADDMHGYRESNFAQGMFMNYDLGYGEGEGASGVLLAISLEDSYFDCTSYGAAGDTFTTSRLSSLNDLVYDYLRRGDWYGAVKGFITQCDRDLTSTGYTYYVPQYTDPAIDPTLVITSPAQRRARWLAFLPMGFIGSGAIGLIAVLIMKGQNKNIGISHTADQYITADGVKLQVSRDNFTGKTRSVARIPRSSGGGGGGGGGHSYHSSGFTSSGGGRHF